MKTQFGKRTLESEKCVLCGERQATTKEHIPPKSLFDKLPRDYLTVPACIDCNDLTKLDDEYLLQVMAGGSLVGEGLRIWKKKVSPKLKTLPKTRNGLRKRVLKRILEINPGDLINASLIELDRQRIERSLKKMICGLYWFHTGSILAQQAQLNIDMLNAVDTTAYFNSPTNLDYYKQTILGIYQDQMVMNTFFYTVAISEETALLYFFFYKQNVFIASVHIPTDNISNI